MTPAERNSTPSSARPAASCAAMCGPDSRVSMPIRTRGFGVRSRAGICRARARRRTEWRRPADKCREYRECRPCRTVPWSSWSQDEPGHSANRFKIRPRTFKSSTRDVIRREEAEPWRGTRVTWISAGETCTTVAPNGAPTISGEMLHEPRFLLFGDPSCPAAGSGPRRPCGAATRSVRARARAADVGTSPDISSWGGMLVNSSGTWKPTSAYGSAV